MEKGLWRYRQTLQEGLRQLVDESLPVERRVSMMLNPAGKYHLEALHQPTQWPVYNNPVRKTLRIFKYSTARGLSDSSKYLAFAEEARKFMRETGARDMLALDCFFYWYSEE